MSTESKKIHILGKVAAPIVKNLVNIHNLVVKPDELFLFVGYNFHEYKINSSFDIAINEADQKWKFDYKIKLKRIYDEYGRSHKSIPEGYKTICLFECKPNFPEIVRKLPTVKTWNFEKTGVFLCNHSDINLLQAPETNTIIFTALEKLVLSNFSMKKKSTFSIEELEDILPAESSKFIIDNMLISGSIRKNNEQLELVH